MKIGISQGSKNGKAGFPADLSWDPPTDVVETDSEIVVIVEIAGMEHDDIEVVTNGELLTIGGVRKASKCDRQRQYHQIEIRFGRFSRDIALPVPVDRSEVSASYENGILEVRLGKLDMSERARKVEIK
jgi:HSP20 family protein